MSWASRVERNPITLDDLIEGAVERGHAGWLNRTDERTLTDYITTEVQQTINAYNGKQLHEKR